MVKTQGQMAATRLHTIWCSVPDLFTTSRKVLIEQIDMVLLHGVEEPKIMTRCRGPTLPRTSKRHITLVSLQICHKIVKVQYFAWHLGLQMWSGSEWVSASNFKFSWPFKKIPYPKCFLVLTQHLMQDGPILFCKGGFCCLRCV